ncbi:MAG: rhomboid family intramembrane serine protease [Promicromonosporaceae bacterium]|nr:rhomboid family intramembrane serine protease [Promicromonosporaceae bacterium]
MPDLELDYSQWLEPEVPAVPGDTAPVAEAVEKEKKPRKNPLKRIQYNAPVTLTFTLLALAVLGLAQLTGGASNFWFSVSRSPITDPTLYLRLFTHVLGHANWAHYFGNFMMILLLGPILEEKYGSLRLGIMIAVTALVTGLLHILFSPFGILGASGVVFMMILLASITNIEQGRIPLTLILVLVLYLGQEVITWVTTDTNVAHSAHIIGGICGAVFGMMLSPARDSGSGTGKKLGKRKKRKEVDELSNLSLPMS